MSNVCAGFVPHAVRATRCKRCFREIGDHKESDGPPAGLKTGPKVKSKLGDAGKTKKKQDGDGEVGVKTDGVTAVRRRRDAAAAPPGGDEDDEEKKKANRRSREIKQGESDPAASARRRRNGTDGQPSSETSRKRVQIVDTQEVSRSESPRVPPETSSEVTSPDVEFILKVKTSTTQQREQDETESICATETTETTLTFHDTIEDLQDAARKLGAELEVAELKVEKLQKEKEQLMKRRVKNEKDDEAMDQMASEILKLRSEVNKLTTINEEVKDENKVFKLEVKELQEEVAKRQPPEVVQTTLNQMKTKLHQTESLCEELMEENKEIKKEIEELEEEIEEMQDSFHEDQADEYRDLRKELEVSSKNCRVLQFKLRKTEKKCEELEEDKTKLTENLDSLKNLEIDRLKMTKMDEELKLAKDVSKQLTLELEELKKKTGKSSVGAVVQKEANKDNAGMDSGQLLRDLYDAVERENDLKEQLKFAEEAANTTRKTMASLEQENESLLLQVRKMAQSRLGKHPREEVKTDETSPEHLKLQLELNEQELIVLRKKLDETENEKEAMKTEVQFLREKVSSQPMTTVEVPEVSSNELSDDCKYHQHQIRVLQNEAKELRRKLIDRERDNDRLKTEVEVLRKKGSKVMVRSRSLDGDLQVDLKRQLQLVEQEVSILRQKSSRLETDNEQLMSENKRMSLRLSRKPPPSSNETLQLENMELKVRIEELQQKVKQLLEEVKPDTDEKVEVVRRGSLTESEQELITSLKKRVKLKEEELAELHMKTAKVEIDNNKLSRDLKKLKDKMMSVKKRDLRKVRDDATRLDLREIIQELEEEISDLYISLRGRETIQESLQDVLQTEKKQQDGIRKELQQKCEEMEQKMRQAEEERRVAVDKLSTAHEELRMAHLKLSKVSSTKGATAGGEVDKTFHVGKLKEEKKELEEKMMETKEMLESKVKLMEEAEDRVKQLMEEKGAMADRIQVIEREKKALHKEVKVNKEAVNKVESKLKEANASVQELQASKDKAHAELSKAKDEVNENKSRLKNVDERQTEVAVGWLKERDELKKKITDLTNKLQSTTEEQTKLQETLSSKEAEVQQKANKEAESKLKEANEALFDEIKELKDERGKMKVKTSELEEALLKAQREVKDLQEKIKKMMNQQRKEKDEWQSTENDLESQMKALNRKMEKMEREHKSDTTAKDEDLLVTKDKLVKVERDLRRLKNKQEETERESQDKIKVLERDLNKEKQEYEDLTAKYDLLEEDYVVVKAKLVMDKEKIEAEYNRLKQEHETVNGELHTVRDTFNARQDIWIKEKLDKEEKLKELTAKVNRTEGWEVERGQLKDTLAQNASLMDSYKKEEKHLKDERDGLRRQVEDQARIMAELQKVATGTSQTLGDESERLSAVRKEKEQMVSLMGEEIQTMQKQIMAFQKERDSYKEKLKVAEEKLKLARLDTRKQGKVNSTDSEKVSELQYEIEDLEDQLAGSKLEVNNLRTEYLSEKTRWSIELAEMKTKLNQLEEQNLIDGLGRSSRMLAKTKLELAWDKERSEQQRLLSESRRLITDLRDKLITVETLRDKERVDAKRQLQNLKDTMEGEQGDTKKKIGELHHDLNDLRQTHARTRSTNESLQKDKEYHDAGKEELRIRLVQLETHHEQLSSLLSEVEKLSEIAPEVLEESINITAGSRSELSPYRGRPPLIKAASEDNRRAKDEFQDMLNSILQKTEELKRVQARSERSQRAYRRTLSATERQLSSHPSPLPGISSIMDSNNPYQTWSSSRHRPNLPSPPPSMYITPPTFGRSLNRKSLSLQDQTTNTEPSDSKIWQSTDTSDQGSIESLASHARSVSGIGDFSTAPVRPERRLSERRRRNGDSVPKEEPVKDVPERRSRKSVKDKLKTLVSSKSIEESNTGKNIAEVGKMTASVGIGSETPDERRRDRSITSKIRNAFKKPSSRSASIDRDSDKESLDGKSISAAPLSTKPSRRGKLEPQSSIESVTSTASATLKPKKKSLLNRLTPGKRSKSIDITPSKT